MSAQRRKLLCAFLLTFIFRRVLLYKESVREGIPQRVSESNEITGHMVGILAKVKSGELKLDSPEDAIGILMERMNVGESDMVGAMDLFEDLFGGDPL